MSNDGEYLLAYEMFDEPCMQEDKDFLESEHGGECVVVSSGNGCTLYWDKPKYRLMPEEIANLQASQVFERCDTERWVIVKDYPV